MPFLYDTCLVHEVLYTKSIAVWNFYQQVVIPDTKYFCSCPKYEDCMYDFFV
jgi:hypothetical protein